jgi:hypothetical protein
MIPCPCLYEYFCQAPLEVRADNYPAQRLYEAVGFDNAASYGGAVQVWFLEKRL